MPPDLADELLIEVPPEALQPPQPPAKPRTARLGRLPMSFVRIPVSWFDGSDPRPFPLSGERGRLFLFLLHLSRWGQRPVILTTAASAQIGQSRQTRSRYLKQLEAEGWIHITREGRKTMAVRPIVIAG